MVNRRVSLEKRFRKKIGPPNDRGCWIWQGRIGGTARSGYGSINYLYRQLLAHRVSYEIAHGISIPQDLTINHICRTKACVNPAHLEVVSIGDNVRHYTQSIRVCPKGHPYDWENTYITPRKSRVCRACMRETMRNRRWEAKTRAALEKTF